MDLPGGDGVGSASAGGAGAHLGSGKSMTRRSVIMRRIVLIVMVALVSGIGWVWYKDPLGMRLTAPPSAPVAPEPAGEDEGPYVTEPRAGGVIPPGTVIGTTAPPGWTHLIVKSRPRVA